MQIDGLSEKPKPTIEEVGEFKLKDREGRSAVQIDLSKSSRPMNEAKYLYIAKVQGQNNKISKQRRCDYFRPLHREWNNNDCLFKIK